MNTATARKADDMRQRERWTEGRGLRGKWQAWRIDRAYPVPETWTADELHRQSLRKVRELTTVAARGGRPSVLKEAARHLLDQAHQVEDETRQLAPGQEPAAELITKWFNVRRESFGRAWV